MIEFTRDARSFLEKGLSRKITITHHVSGVRVSVGDWDSGELVNEVAPTIETAFYNCMEQLEESINRKTLEKITRLKDKKKEIEKELQKVNRDLGSIRLSLFKDIK